MARGISTYPPSSSGSNLHSQLFTASGTFTPPAGVTLVRVVVVSGGWSGNGGSAGAISVGGSGGVLAGSDLVNVTPGVGITVTVGSGGSGSTGDTVTGGSSSFGAIAASGSGSAGGAFPNTTTAPYAGGNGGFCGGGGLNASDSSGNLANRTVANPGVCSGHTVLPMPGAGGGAGEYGGGGAGSMANGGAGGTGGSGSTTTGGSAPANSGGGGGGGAYNAGTPGAGGSGGSGFVLVAWWA